MNINLKRPVKELGLLYNEMDYTNIGVEIGVQRGYTTECILNTWKGKYLYSIDSYKHYSVGYDDCANVSNEEHEYIYQQTKEKLKIYKERSILLRMESIEASKLFLDDTLDFVYIDANHSYRAVMNDLNAWYPKVKTSGLIGGHDYHPAWGVPKAVQKFFSILNKEIIIGSEAENYIWQVLK